MPNHVDCETNLFADDTTGYVVGKSVDTVLKNIQCNLDKFHKYASRNSLTLHPDKCEVLIISRSKFIGPIQKLEIQGKEINIVKSSKCLGITIDEKLSWEVHIENVCRSFRSKIKKLYKMRNMPRSTLHTIYFQGILPSVIYGILIWGSCHLLSSVEKLHLQAARFINRIKKNTNDNYVLQQCNWKSISYYYKRSVACKTYKIYNELGSPILRKYITKASSSRTTRNKYRLILPTFKSTAFKQSFTYRSSIVWNNIPCELRQKNSTNTFKVALSKSDVLEQINFGTNATGRAYDHVDYIYF